MVTLKGLLQTVKKTRNFWAAFSWINPEKRVKVIFRNGCIAELNLLEYRQILSILSKGYTIESHGQLLCFKKGNVKITGPILLLSVLCEGVDKIYSVDCKNKTVLDIGGFIGDSAVYFSAAGAAKVIIYEPVVAHHEFIKLNVALNGVNAELHEEGIGENDGVTLINYDKTDDCFGLTNRGAKKMLIKIKSIKRIIEESGASIAKLDCEGAESALVKVPPEVLQAIDFYIVEIHTPELKNTLVNKFRASGFAIVKDIPTGGDENVSTVYFRRKQERLQEPMYTKE
jgi:FkbM family methyltransferase